MHQLVDLAAGGDTREADTRGALGSLGKKVTLQLPHHNELHKTRFDNLKRLPPIQPLEGTNALELSVNVLNIDLTEQNYLEIKQQNLDSRKLTTQVRSIKINRSQIDNNSNREKDEDNAKGYNDKRMNTRGGVNNNNEEISDNVKEVKRKKSTKERDQQIMSLTKQSLLRSYSVGSFAKNETGRNKKYDMDYLPSYKMEPEIKERFNPCAIKRIIQNTADTMLSKFQYSGEEAGNMINKLSSTIIKRIKINQNCRRYKLVCHVFLVNMSGQTAFIADRSLWYKDTDNVAVYSHRDRKFACVITVHGMYKE